MTTLCAVLYRWCFPFSWKPHTHQTTAPKQVLVFLLVAIYAHVCFFFVYSRNPGPLNQESRRYRDGEKPPRSSWHNVAPGARAAPPVTVTPQSSVSAAPRSQNRSATQPPARTFQSSRRPEIRSHPKATLRPQAPENERAPRLRGRGSHGPPHHTQRSPQEDEEEEGEIPTVATTYTAHYYKNEQETTSSSQQKDESGTVEEQQSSLPGTVREVSPPPERPVEKKSYSLARRSRARPSDLSKQASLEEAVLTPQVMPTATKNESWQRQGETGTQSGLSRLDQDLARLSLAGQNWTQSPPSYLLPEMRGTLTSSCLTLCSFVHFLIDYAFSVF